MTGGRLPKRKLSAQIYESATWQISYVEDFLSLPDELLPGKFSKIHELVLESAKALGLTLVHRTGPSRVETSKSSLKRKERAHTTGIDSDSSVDMSIHDSDSELESFPRASKRTARSFHIASAEGARTKTFTLKDVARLATPPTSVMSLIGKVKPVPTARQERSLLPAIALTVGTSPITSSRATNAPGTARRKASRSDGIPSHGESDCEIVAH